MTDSTDNVLDDEDWTCPECGGPSAADDELCDDCLYDDDDWDDPDDYDDEGDWVDDEEDW